MSDVLIFFNQGGHGRRRREHGVLEGVLFFRLGGIGAVFFWCDVDSLGFTFYIEKHCCPIKT